MLKAEYFVSGRTELPHFSPMLYASIPLASLTRWQANLECLSTAISHLMFVMNSLLRGFHIRPQVHYVPNWTICVFLNFSLIPDLKPWGQLTFPFVFSSIINLLSSPLQLLSHLSLPLFSHVTLLDQKPFHLPF